MQWLFFKSLEAKIRSDSSSTPLDQTKSSNSQELNITTIGDLPVDAVYTWCDHSDPKFLDDLLVLNKSDYVADAYRPQRFRSHDELLYSLRSLDQYAPWIRKVYLVTDGQVPTWIKTDDPKLKIVKHSEIFEDKNYLPTFNSLSIELNLVRIPGLSEHFLYFNDDFFLGNFLSKETYLNLWGELLFFLESYPLPNPTKSKWKMKGYDLMKRIHCYNHWLLKRKFGKLDDPRDPPHAPQMYQKSILLKMNEEWKLELKSTFRSRFRDSENFKLSVIYPYYAAQSKEIQNPYKFQTIFNSSGDYFFRTMKNDVLQHLGGWIKHISETKPLFFCLNDEIEDSNLATQAGNMLRQMLDSYFPVPSRFENAN